MITEDRVENLPKWLESDTYDLSAKAPSPDLDTESLRAMLQSLLRRPVRIEDALRRPAAARLRSYSAQTCALS